MRLLFKLNESRYIALFMVSGSIKKLSSIDYFNIYLVSLFRSIYFARWKRVGLYHYLHRESMTLTHNPLTINVPHRNQPIDLHYKSVDWFLCDRNIGHH